MNTRRPPLPAQSNGAHSSLHVLVGDSQQTLDDSHVLGTGEVPVTRWGFDEGTDAGQVAPSGTTGHGLATDEDPARGGLHEGQQHLHGRGLARAVGPEEAVDGALAHLEVEIAHHGGVTVALGEAIGCDCESS